MTKTLSEALCTYFAQRLDVVAAVLFGSAARNQLRPDSDVDVALLFADDAVPMGWALIDLQRELELRIKHEVDVVVLNGASPIIAHQAIKTGQLIWCRDRAAYLRYVVRLISEYADFKIIRRPIEEAVLKRRVL